MQSIVEITYMDVLCCFGSMCIARDAIVRRGLKIAFEDITIDLHGNVSRAVTFRNLIPDLQTLTFIKDIIDNG
jgi:hypothetical protein